MTMAAPTPLVKRARAILRNPAIWMTLIAAATLLPSPGSDPGLMLCLICGERGTADAIANVVLFFPLGYALARRSGTGDQPKYKQLVLPLLISLAVELLQIGIPGRNPSLSDLVFNTLGGLLGYRAAARSAQLHSFARRLWLAYAGAAALSLVLTAWLVAPAPTDGIHFGQWTAEFRGVRYGGRVLQAHMGDKPIADAIALASAGIHGQLLAGASIRVLAVAGPPPERVAALFSVADLQAVFNLFIGIERDDVVFEYRTRANVLRLDQLHLRATDLMRGIRPGDTLRFALEQAPGGVSISVNGVEARPGPHLAMGWQLLFGSTDFPPWLESWLNMVWIAACLAPIGYASTDFFRLAAPGALVILLLAGLPAVSWLAPSPLSAYVAAVIGLAVGALFRFDPANARSG